MNSQDRYRFGLRLSYGFTLIELLVVISIIALLMGIMLPALGKAREKAKFTVCKTNVHTLTLAGIHYATDNADRFPPSIALMLDKSSYAWPNQLSYNRRTTWPADHPLSNYESRWLKTYMKGYIDNPEILFCPLSPSNQKNFVTMAYEDPMASTTELGSYAFYWGGYQKGSPSSKYTFEGPKKTSDNNKPIVSDLIAYRLDGFFTTHYVTRSAVQGSGGMWYRADTPDNIPKVEAWNFGYSDGHIEKIKASDLAMTDFPTVAKCYVYLPLKDVD